MYNCHVSCFSLDVQRPPGEELRHPDDVVACERQVAMCERGLERLVSRPVRDREWYWGQEVVMVEAKLAVLQDLLRLCQAERDGETGLGSVEDRARQLTHQWKAIEQYRPPN